VFDYSAKELNVSQGIHIFPDGRLDRPNAAKYTGFAVKTLAMHASSGTGPKFRKIGGRVFYRREDLDAWLNSFAIVQSTAQARARGHAA
jgi:predicted DNA-binding transcriptional regulator AlpA